MNAEVIAIVDGTLIDGTGANPISDVAVIVEDNRITAVGRRKSLPIQKNARILNAKGRTILPGLIDMHQHWPHEWDKALFPQNGITSMRFAGWMQAPIFQLIDRIQRGELVGPRIFSVGPIMDRPPTARPESALVVNTLEEARREAERLIREEHVDALFAARRINGPFLKVILEVAHAHGKPVTGQVYELSGRQAAEMGIDGLENTARIPESSIFDHQTLHNYRSVSHRLAMLGRLWATAPADTMQDVLGAMAEHGVEWAPGLVSFEHWAGFLDNSLEADPDYQEAPADLKQVYWEQKANLSREWTEDTLTDWARGLERAKYWIGYYHKIGGAIVTGTDTPLGAITYHWELRHLREAGLSPMEIIVAATSKSAHALRQPSLGIIASEKLADIIVVEGDPLKDLDTLRHPVHVLVNGRPEVVDGHVREVVQ
jgi:hypothetical protein